MVVLVVERTRKSEIRKAERATSVTFMSRVYMARTFSLHDDYILKKQRSELASVYVFRKYVSISKLVSTQI